MGSALAEMKRAGQKPEPHKDDEQHDDGPKPPALIKLAKEAEARGATLATGGEGGLPPEVVLEVMRRDGYQCKKCGGRSMLSIHHKGRHLENVRFALTQKHKNDPSGIVTICEDCHDDIHDEDRAGGPDDPNTGESLAKKREGQQKPPQE